MTLSIPQFFSLKLTGPEAAQFLQGQITADIKKIESISSYVPTSICDLKGRVQFGIWVKAISQTEFEIVVTESCKDALFAHLKKYSIFAKLKLGDYETVFPFLYQGITEFSKTEQQRSNVWAYEALPLGEYWIVSETMNLFQPQELRLHQRNGVHYDKGCYLGQEVVARLYFKAKPKRWLHLVEGEGSLPQPSTDLGKDIQVVNSLNLENSLPENNRWMALVVASPVSLIENSHLKVLDLPPAINGEVGRSST